MGRVTGRASAHEERLLRKEDGLPALPRRKAQRRTVNLRRKQDWSAATHMSGTVTFEQYEKHFTRDYVPGDYYKPRVLETVLKADNENERKADWPVFGEAWKGTLLTGEDEGKTFMLNTTAIWLLREIRRLTELSGQHEKHDQVGQEHNQTGEDDGFGHDSVRDMGPTPEMLISKWIGSDVQRNVHGKLKCVPRVTSKEIKAKWKSRTGALVADSWCAGEIDIQASGFLTRYVADKNAAKKSTFVGHYPRSIGDIRFNAESKRTEFCGVDKNGERRWLKFMDRTRASKSNNNFLKDMEALSTNGGYKR